MANGRFVGSADGSWLDIIDSLSRALDWESPDRDCSIAIVELIRWQLSKKTRTKKSYERRSSSTVVQILFVFQPERFCYLTFYGNR